MDEPCSCRFRRHDNGEYGWAQVTATVSGKVEDASGAAVGGATVTVKSLETGATRTVTTDETGNYRVLSLPSGPRKSGRKNRALEQRCAPESIWLSARKPSST